MRRITAWNKFLIKMSKLTKTFYLKFVFAGDFKLTLRHPQSMLCVCEQFSAPAPSFSRRFVSRAARTARTDRG